MFTYIVIITVTILSIGLLESTDVNHQVCPVLEELTAFESVDDFRTEAVALMTRYVFGMIRKQTQRKQEKHRKL